jgi:hypothetical protein
MSKDITGIRHVTAGTSNSKKGDFHILILGLSAGLTIDKMTCIKIQMS